MEERVVNAALAGLLHDVGKFAQRAGEGFSETWDKEAERDYGYQHALASYGFVKTFVPESWRKELSGVAYHHRPQKQQDYWTRLADWLSSAEREHDEDNLIPRMQSVFSHLNGHNQARYLPLERFDPRDRKKLFPIPLENNDWGTNSQKLYANLWHDFEAACRSQGLSKIANKIIYLEKLFTLLQEFTWCIPSAYWQGVPDVSLYDHLRTTAAVAACLAKDDRSEDWCEQVEKTNDPVCYLVGADFSNLQSFIYTLASSGAAKSLRARSFYVQLISEIIAQAILDGIKMPLTNVIYVGGGGFELLAPITSEKYLVEITRDLTDRLLEVHQGALGLTIKWIEVRYTDFSQFNQVRDHLGKEINRAKSQPFVGASPEKLYQAVGQPLTQGGDPIRFCQVTGEDGDTIQLDRDGEYKSRFVLSLEELGGQLPKATHILSTRVDPEKPARATDWRQALRTFGTDVQILTSDIQVKIEKASQDGYFRVWRLEPFSDQNKEGKSLQPLGDALRVVSYRPFAKLTPLNEDGYPLTFDELAQPRRGGFKRWGVLRMDVDNLGKLFREGFGEKATLSRLASLSFALRLFFEGWLPELAKDDPSDPLRKDDLRNYLYLQYSGGDDVFIVGAWDVLPEFARRIHSSFSEYATENPHVTLSGGMSIVNAGFPLYQAARQAGEAEESAKTFKAADGKEKNAFAFLGYPLNWITFMSVQAEAERLADGVEKRHLPKALIQNLLSLNDEIQYARRKGIKLIFGRWTWMAAYQLTRLAMQVKDDNDRRYIETLRNKFLIPNPETEALGLAARWAQYLTRGV